MRILTSDEMREVDRRAIEELGIPGVVLMENAAIGVVDALSERFPEARQVAILCGPGNNGGDGLAVARHLEGRRIGVFVVLCPGRRRPQGDAGTQLDILERSGFGIREVTDMEGVAEVLQELRTCDVVLDALFGTGLTRPLEGHLAFLVEELGSQGASVLAVDLPSGLDASRDEPIGPSVRADLTVTFAAPKIAHVFGSASDLCGEVVVTDLGTPSGLVENAPGDLHLMTTEELASWWVPREAASHKGTYGHALLVAGSPGKAGAVILAARAAVAGGAGLVTAAVPAELLSVVDGGCLESMTASVGGDHLDVEAVDEVVELASSRSALGLGPGLGTSETTAEAVRLILARTEVPAVVDADGLNALAGRVGELRERSGATVLTPHPGEMARLLGSSTSAVQADRLAAIRRCAQESGAVVVLKGDRTLVAAPEGEVRVNRTGNPGMATGGSGDVLTGLVLALLAQGLDPMAAACLGVHLHGLAGDLALVGPALPAARLVDALPEAFRLLEAS